MRLSHATLNIQSTRSVFHATANINWPPLIPPTTPPASTTRLTRTGAKEPRKCSPTNLRRSHDVKGAMISVVELEISAASRLLWGNTLSLKCSCGMMCGTVGRNQKHRFRQLNPTVGNLKISLIHTQNHLKLYTKVVFLTIYGINGRLYLVHQRLYISSVVPLRITLGMEVYLMSSNWRAADLQSYMPRIRRIPPCTVRVGSPESQGKNSKHVHFEATFSLYIFPLYIFF